MFNRFNTQALFSYSDAQSPLVRYGLAVLAVAAAALATQAIPVIGQRAAFMFFFVAIIQASYWLGHYPGLFVLALALPTVNGLVLLPAWALSPGNAAILNLGFMLVSANIIYAASHHRQLAAKLWLRGQDLNHAQAVAQKPAEEELRNAQTCLNLVVEEMKVGYWDWDLLTRCFYVSPEWKWQLGIDDNTPLDNLETWQSRVHPDDQAFVLTAAEDYIVGKQAIYELDYRLRHQDGSYRWIHSRGVLLRDRQNQPYRLLGLNLDITDYRQSSEFNARRNRMEQSFRTYVASQTAAAIAHELNQPLTAISYYADVAQELLQTGIQNPQKLSEVMEKCSQQALRAGSVIRQLMAILHKGEAANEPIDITVAVREAISFIMTDGQLSDFKISLDLAAALPLVTANSLQVQKVLINLLHNASESMQESGGDVGTIKIITRPATDDPSFAQITVIDCGKGVADVAMLKTIFQPFHTTKPAGLGMGLAISRALIEAHNGKMWAEQNAGPGLSIHFTLPFAL